ncbi:hypothetical protein MSAN_00762700 [Mycena sanguinolenta]|uniref:Uncharacterized protein n=1 Tax=Mycena sanguinolenta TaxID=230812 RepID=A0A8H6Z643_9AGAR|nr:hypothetical protein MSAN_00762700 [Mycena sanguinolenta]
MQSNNSLRQSASTLGKAEDQQSTGEVKYTRRMIWPLCIIVGQGLLLSLAWGFFAGVRARGRIPLPATAALLAQNNPLSKTYIVTFLATSLSAVSSYLFSQAVRHTILVYLTRSLSVSTLGFGILISRRTLILERQAILWVLTGGVFFLATLGQTASWTALLTPNTVVSLTPLEGKEIDLRSDAFSESTSQFYALWNGTAAENLQNYLESSSISPFLGASGIASASYAAGYYSVVNFNGQDYLASTGGIAPTYLIDANLASTTKGLSTSNTKPLPPAGTLFNTSMIQQGLTADVSCQYQQLNENTNPPVMRDAYTVNIQEGNVDVPYSVTSVSTVCPNGQVITSSLLSGTNETLVSLICATTNVAGSPTYTVIIDGQGVYAGPNGASVQCTMTPQIQDYVVSYSGRFIDSIPVSEPLDPRIAPAPAGVADIAAYCLSRVFQYGQNGMRNVVGDSMSAIFTGQNYEGRSLSETTLWEDYIRGVVEFVGTAVKWDLTWVNGPLGGNPPSTMTHTISGHAFTTSLGWEYNKAASPAFLIPSTFVAVASILIALFAQFRNRGIPEQHADFDPNDPLMLMAAASAGGLRETFPGLTQSVIKEGGLTKVSLGQIDDRHGFVEVV